MGDKEIWSSTAPEYKKRGEMYATIEYDDNGDPRRVRVGQNQVRKGEFRVEGDVAVYEPHGLSTIPEADAEVENYVLSLPFINSVDMSALNN